MPPSPTSHAQLLRLPNVLALLSATTLARLAGRMFGLTLVLHALAAFHSPVTAGWIAFAAVAPGLVVSPLAGAFLDRAGAARGIVADLAASAIVALALALCAIQATASPSLIALLAALYALTSPLSAAGIRTLLPRLVPATSLDKANALDTAIHAVVDVVGPSLAGVLTGVFGASAAFLVIALCYASATASVALIHQPQRPPPPKSRFLAQAMEGLGFVARRKFLRGLAVGYALNQVTWGILVVAVPVVLAQTLDPAAWQQASGLLWAWAGIAGALGALAAGQLRVSGREVPTMAASMAVTALAVWPLAAQGLPGLATGMALAGFLAGPIDVGVLTLRQRRTDPAQLGRVLAVSMSLNMAGFPIGTALGGMLVAMSPSAAFMAAALASLLAAAATCTLIPAEETAPGPPPP